MKKLGLKTNSKSGRVPRYEKVGSEDCWWCGRQLPSLPRPIYRHKDQPLLDEQAALRAWLRDRDPDGSDYLFTSQKGGRLHRSQFFRIFRDCAFAAGLPPEKRHPHALKHSLASHLVAGNMNLAWVKQCLGHKAISSTMKYVAVSDSQAAETAQAALIMLY